MSPTVFQKAVLPDKLLRNNDNNNFNLKIILTVIVSNIFGHLPLSHSLASTSSMILFRPSTSLHLSCIEWCTITTLITFYSSSLAVWSILAVCWSAMMCSSTVPCAIAICLLAERGDSEDRWWSDLHLSSPFSHSASSSVDPTETWSCRQRKTHRLGRTPDLLNHMACSHQAVCVWRGF